MKTIIERGASWTLEETKLLLSLWGQDLIVRQSTNAKRSKEVYEKISEKFAQNGFERTPDQVRTRVFNMIAEYRRILKDPSPERMRKCIFFDPLDRIYSAKNLGEIKAILDNYEPEFPCSPSSNTISSEKGEDSLSDSDIVIDTNKQQDAATATGLDVKSTSKKQQESGDDTTSAPTPQSKKIRLSSAEAAKNQTTTTTTTTTTSTTGSSTATNNTTTATGKDFNQSQDTPSTPSGSSKQSKVLASSKATETPTATVAVTTMAATNTVDASDTRPRVMGIYGIEAKQSSDQASKQQRSLLLPHGAGTSSSASPSTSTPITKITTTTSANNNTPSYININSTKLPIIRTNQLIGPNGNESINLANGTATRLPTTAAISHQLYQAPVNTFDVTSSALLIDRMFAHLSRESENMREWIALEKERLAIEKIRRQQETEREFRRERVLMDTLMKFQDQWLSFLSRLDPKTIESLGETPPELKIPPPTATTASSSATTSSTTAATTDNVPHLLSQTTATYSTLSNSNNNNNTNSNSSAANCATNNSSSSTSKQTPETDKQ